MFYLRYVFFFREPNKTHSSRGIFITDIELLKCLRYSQRQEGRWWQEQDGSHAHGIELHQNGHQHTHVRHRTHLRVQERRSDFDQRAHPNRTVHHGVEKEQRKPTTILQNHRNPVALVANRILRCIRFVQR